MMTMSKRQRAGLIIFIFSLVDVGFVLTASLLSKLDGAYFFPTYTVIFGSLWAVVGAYMFISGGDKR